MNIIYIGLWLCSIFTNPHIVGTYENKGKSNSVGGVFKYVSTLELKVDSTYIYTDVSFKPNNSVLDSDTVTGKWGVMSDTLKLTNYHAKWLIKRNKLIKLTLGKNLVYRRK